MSDPNSSSPTALNGTHAAVSRAVVQHRYGAPDVLSVVARPTPVPSDGEVLVAVRAASVNARDWHIMRGEPRLARFLDPGTFTPRRPRVPTRGTDFAGVIEAVGPGVTDWRPGDQVFGEALGTFAEHVTVGTKQLARMPDAVTFEEAAAVPLAGVTALECLRAADPADGQTVLINGASGGVGTFAIQLGKTMGLDVAAVCSTRNVSQARRLGADATIDYTVQDFTRSAHRYDVVIDLVGNRRLRELRAITAPCGAIVLSGGGVPGTGRNVGPLALLVRAQAYARLTRLRLRTPLGVPQAATLEHLGQLVATGQVRPVVEATYPLTRVGDAIRHMETHHTTGKVVITVE
jgi:NADPH:quinone reductase-like Zn-dependent oxidoreductase